jgi:hypothetical protein
LDWVSDEDSDEVEGDDVPAAVKGDSDEDEYRREDM